MAKNIFETLLDKALELRNSKCLIPPWEVHVLGGPGCGKTSRMHKYVEEACRVYGPDKLMICSFTDAAAWNAVRRLSAISGIDIDRKTRNIRTLHSFAFRQLGGDVKIAEVHCRAEWNQRHPSIKLSERTGDDANREIETQGDKLLAEVQKNRATRLPRERWSIKALGFEKSWSEFKLSTGSLDFTDMIETCLYDERYNYLPEDAIKVMFVDEAQDLSPLELDLIRKWGESALFVVLFYDPNQCIYSWKGAEPSMLLSDHIIHTEVLQESFRLPQVIDRENRRWMRRLPGAHISYAPRNEAGRIRVATSVTIEKPEMLIQDIGREGYLTNGRQVMILTSCGYMINKVQARLFEEGIPFGNPYRPDDRKWNPLGKSPHDASHNSVDRLRLYLLPDKHAYGDEARLPVAEELKVLADTLVLDVLLSETGEPGELQGMSLLRQLHGPVDIDTLRCVFKPDVVEKILNPDVDWYLQNIKPKYNQKVTMYAVRVYRRFGGAALIDSKNPRVVIGTIHSVKGGEADVVYLFPDLSPAGKEQYEGKHRDSVIRSFYVGQTRARYELILCGSRSKNKVEW